MIFFRPVGIYKEDYIVELYRRYDDVEDATRAPPLPDWCVESDDDGNDMDDFDDIQNNGATSSQ